MKHMGMIVDRFSRVPSITRYVVNGVKTRYAIFKNPHKSTKHQDSRFYSDERPMLMSDLEAKEWAI